MEDLKQGKKPVGYDPEEDDQELQNLNDIPTKEDETRVHGEDDDDNYSDDETKKKLNTQTATTAVSSGNASEEAEKTSQVPKKLRTPAKDESSEDSDGEY